MERLSTPAATAAVLDRYNISARKKYGQNFLADGSVIDSIIEAAGVTLTDHVIEIGPGLGSLTQALAETAGHVTAVEIDSKLLPALDETLAGYGNVTLLNADIMKTDLEELASPKKGCTDLKVVANLPYYITTPVILRVLESELKISNITVMVQQEVADRMAAPVGTKDYGALTLAVQYHAEVSIARQVPPECFIPRPKVYSAVVRLDMYSEPPVKSCDPELMSKIVRAAFGQRRKTLVNTLGNAPDIAFSKQQVSEALESMGKDTMIRGEKLSLEEFAALTDRLCGAGGKDLY